MGVEGHGCSTSRARRPLPIQDGVIAGTVFAGDKVFEVLLRRRGRARSHAKSSRRSFRPTIPTPISAAPEPDPQAEAMDAAVAADMAADAASQIDVMVIWTPAARTAAGGTSAIQSVINLAVANTNTAYANSAVTQRLRLVYAGELSLHRSGHHRPISAGWSRPSDGFLDSVHDTAQHLRRRRRDAAGQRVHQCWRVRRRLPDDVRVYAALPATPSTSWTGLVPPANLSYAHELGHNMGLQHDPNNASGSAAYSYAYGYQHPAGAFRTVMAYACPTGACPRVTALCQPVGELQRHADRHGLAEHRACAEQHRADASRTSGRPSPVPARIH